MVSRVFPLTFLLPFYVVSKQTSYLVYRLIVEPTHDKTVPEMGVVTSRDTFLILGAASISQEWLKLEVSNFFYKGRLY